jgi:hypothetical protein
VDFDMRYFKLIIVAITFCVNAPSTEASDVVASSVEYADVAEAVAKAAAGDTVILPSGNAIWSNKLIITQEITLRGTGQDKTIVVNALPDDYAGLISIAIETNTPLSTRITGITFESDQINTNQSHIFVSGDGEFRIDNCNFRYGFTYLSGAIRTIGYGTYGLIDNCVFDTSAKEAVHVNEDNLTWEEDSSLGTKYAVYIEDCVFKNTPGGHAITMNFGAKTVIRYNEIRHTDIDVHGRCFNPGRSSGRYCEIYENDFYPPISGYHFGMNIRGGTGVIYNNRLHEGLPGSGFTGEIALTEYRVTADCPNGGCGQGPDGEGYPLLDQIGRGKNQTSEPLYIWNNVNDTDNDGVFDRDVVVVVLDARENVCGPLTTADFIQDVPHDGEENPDYVNNGTARPGYVPYDYPHPLRLTDEEEQTEEDEKGSSDALRPPTGLTIQ